MPLSIRAIFAAVLWGAALVPVVLYGIHLSSPVAAVQVAIVLGEVLSTALLLSGAVFVVGLLIYPPFMPALRLSIRRLKGRLSTDLGPLYEAQTRLEHLETAADRLAVGRILLQQNRLGPALENLARAAELDPEHAGTRYQLGLTLAKIGNLQAAAGQLGKAVELERSHAFGAALLELGIVLEREGADAQAIEVLEQHERDFGPNRRNLFHRARAHARAGDRERSLEVLREAAAPAQEDRSLTAEEDLLRARAKMALLRGGRI